MRWCLLTLILVSLLAFTACSAEDLVPSEPQVLSEQLVTDIVWRALEPNTSSHDKAAWEIIETRSVKGNEIRDQFEGEPVPGNCAPGPQSPENKMIDLYRTYWYVMMKPRSATPQPRPTEQYSPTAPPKIPEPFLQEAHFLIDAHTGEVVARKLYCVIY